ncbi:MAG: hypothetical protein JNK14_00155 [Chitinophagaceae bacterium]|nr:hypothetical protein [Chitinophagaceae bacterium]
MKNVLTLLLCILYVKGIAQSPDYCIYLVSGEVLIAGKGKKPVTAKPRQLVYNTDSFTLKKGAEITLVDMNGGFFVLNSAVTRKPLKGLLAGSTPKTKDGITTKYLKLLFHELLDPHHDFEKLKKENIAGVWGGVSRGDECGNRIFPVNGLQTSVRSITFKWHKTSPSSRYIFVIYDGRGKEFFKTTGKDTVIMLNTSETMKGVTGKYFWRVTSEDGDCEDEVPIYFTLLTQEEERSQAGILTADVTGESLESKMQQIDRLERNAFIHLAADRYDKIVNQNPGNQTLLKSYVLFLLKYGFEEEAKAAWGH